MLETYLQQTLEEMVDELDLRGVWFQQDKTSAHSVRISLAVL
jgi:hypothetical protein